MVGAEDPIIGTGCLYGGSWGSPRWALCPPPAELHSPQQIHGSAAPQHSSAPSQHLLGSGIPGAAQHGQTDVVTAPNAFRNAAPHIWG